MISWGTGMQQNDFALEITKKFQSLSSFDWILMFDKHIKNEPKRDSKKKVRKDRYKNKQKWRSETLALADWLLDKKVDIKSYKKKIFQVIDQEIKITLDQGYSNCRERVQSLENFKRKIKGVKIDKELLKKDQASLFESIYKIYWGPLDTEEED